MAFLCRERAGHSMGKAWENMHLAGGKSTQAENQALHCVSFGQTSRTYTLRALADALADGPLPDPARTTVWVSFLSHCPLLGFL